MNKQQQRRKRNTTLRKQSNNRNRMATRRRTRNVRNQATLPPLRRQLSNLFRTTLRVVWDVGALGSSTKWAIADNYSAAINNGYIFASPMNKYKTIFRAFKIHNITARWMQAVLTQDKMGFNVSSLVHPEFTNSSTSLNSMIASNASVVKPDGQVLVTKYKPLEPSERDWIECSSTHIFAQCLLKTFPEQIMSWLEQVTKNNGLYGKFVVDIDLSMNGLATGVASEACLCDTCTNPVFICATAIQDAYNEKYGGKHLLPYLVEAANYGTTPEEYLRCHSAEDPNVWTNYVHKIVTAARLTDTDQSLIPQQMRSRDLYSKSVSIPSPVPSDYDIAE